MTYAGKDATDVFAAFHAPETWGHLKRFLLGDLEGEEAAREGVAGEEGAAAPICDPLSAAS